MGSGPFLDLEGSEGNHDIDIVSAKLVKVRNYFAFRKNMAQRLGMLDGMPTGPDPHSNRGALLDASKQKTPV